MLHYYKKIIFTILIISVTTQITPSHYLTNRYDRLIDWLSQDFPNKIHSTEFQKKLKKLKSKTKNKIIIKKPFIAQKTAAHRKSITSIILKNKKLITTSLDGTIKIWNPATLECTQIITPNMGGIISAACNKDGTLLAFSTDAHFRGVIWNLKENRPQCILKGYVGKISPTAFFQNNTQILAPSNMGCVHIWNVETGTVVKTYQCHNNFIRTAELYEDEDRFITASDDESACLWDLSSGNLQKKLTGHNDWVTTAIKVDTKIFTAASNKSFCVWDLARGAPKPLPIHPHAQTICIQQNKNGSKLLTTSKKGEIKIWSLPMMKLHSHFKNPRNIPITCATFGQQYLVYFGDQSGTLQTLQHATELEPEEAILLAAFKKYRDKTNCTEIMYPSKSLWEWLLGKPKTIGEELIQKLNKKHNPQKPLIPTQSPINIANLFTLNSKIDTLNRKSSISFIKK